MEVGQKTNEFDAAVAVFHARRDVTILEIQRCQYGAGAQSLVFVIAADCGGSFPKSVISVRRVAAAGRSSGRWLR